MTPFIDWMKGPVRCALLSFRSWKLVGQPKSGIFSGFRWIRVHKGCKLSDQKCIPVLGCIIDLDLWEGAVWIRFSHHTRVADGVT